MLYDDRVLRVFSEQNRSVPNGIYLNIVTKNAASLTKSEYAAIASQISNQQQAFMDFKARALTFTFISVEYRVKLRSVNGAPIDGDKHFVDSSDALAKYFDWSTWPYGGKVSLDDVFVLCDKVPQTDDIELSSFKLNGSNATEILIPYNSLPYMQSLKIIDISSPTPVVRQNLNITQNYSAQQNQHGLELR